MNGGAYFPDAIWPADKNNVTEEAMPVHVYERLHPGWIFRMECVCGHTITVDPIHETSCPDCHRKWQLDMTARIC